MYGGITCDSVLQCNHDTVLACYHRAPSLDRHYCVLQTGSWLGEKAVLKLLHLTIAMEQHVYDSFPTKHTLSKLFDVRFSEAYHLEVPVYVMLAKTPKVSAY